MTQDFSGHPQALLTPRKNHRFAFRKFNAPLAPICAVCFFFLGIQVAVGFQLSPIELTIDLKKAQGSLEIENSDSRPAAITFKVYTRQIDEAGKESRELSRDLLILPLQTRLEPGQKRTIKVIYTGPKSLAQEAAYRVVAEQLPIAFESSASKGALPQIKFLLRFVASIYVSPSVEELNKIDRASETPFHAGLPKTAVKTEASNEPEPLRGKLHASPFSVESMSIDHTALQLEFVVINRSARHQRLDEMQFFEHGDNSRKPLHLSDFPSQSKGGRNILAGGRRRFLFQLPQTFKESNRKVDVEID